jgi:Tol biopolymer transport system component
MPASSPDPRKGRLVDQPAQFISSTRDDYGPQISPDGKKIAFMSSRSGSLEIWVCDADGSNALQVTSFGGPDVTVARWSPDGKHIAFDSNATGQFDIYVVSAEGGKPQRMTTNPANDGNPSWSQDGRWIYFDSGRTGRQQVWKMPANGGEAIEITKDGGYAPLESPDGNFLYYTKGLGSTSLWKVPVSGGEAYKVVEDLSAFMNVAMTATGVYFVSVERPTGLHSIKILKFATNKVSTIATLEKSTIWGIAVSRDGEWILYSPEQQSGSELMLVENFH